MSPVESWLCAICREAIQWKSDGLTNSGATPAVPSGGAGSWFRFSVIFDDPTAEGGVQLMDVSFRLIPSQGSESEELFVFAELEGNTGSATTLDTVYAWFSECSSHHQERCKNPPTSTDGWLPTRLLDVGANSASHWKLLISDIDLRGGPAPAYLTLSYRWGTNPQHALLLSSTLDQYRKGSRISDLPQTFQDLVVVARRFGVRYVWIDCFSIIQDCQDDWEAEAPMMRQVYANAACNIAASASDSPEGGLFQSRTIQDVWPGVIVKKSTLGHEERVYCVDSIYWDRNLLTSSLHTRGWVLWECLEGHRCEGFPNGVPLYDSPKSIDQLLVRPGGIEYLGRLQDQGGNCYRENAMVLDAVNQWCDLFFQEITDETYIAGLWRSRILDLLGWVMTRPKAKPSGAYRAPSWSWASVDGPVEMSKPVLGDVEPLLTVLEVQVSTKREEDKTVGVTGGFIKLRGAFITASYTRDSTRAPRLLQIQLDDGGGTPFSAWPWLDTTEVQFGEGGAFDFLVLHSLVSSSEGNVANAKVPRLKCLVLAPASEVDGTYRRIRWFALRDQEAVDRVLAFCCKCCAILPRMQVRNVSMEIVQEGAMGCRDLRDAAGDVGQNGRHCGET
ncbi:TOL protein [Verticillium dahliae]|nr:TOL protein [Verticillium dahliae]